MRWRILPVNEYSAAASRWQELNFSLHNSPLLDPLFISPLIKNFSQGTEVLAIYGDDKTTAAMGLFSRPRWFAWQTFQPANAPLSLWVCRPTAHQTAMLDQLIRALPGYAVLVGITQLDPNIYPRPSSSERLMTADYINTACIEVSGGFDDYWNARGKNLRHNVKRQHNRLNREGVSTRLEVLVNPEDMGRAVADYSELEASGWKELAAGAVHSDNAQGRFYAEMLKSFAARGEAAVYRYFYNDCLVASDICLERNATMVVLKTAYDESRKGTSPAQLMRHEILQNSFRSKKIERIEFYGRVMDWHRQWTENTRIIYHINFYNSKAIKVLHNAKWSF